jgi:phosphatidylserine synthase
MGLSIHSLGIVALLGLFILNIVLLKVATSLQKYKRLNSIILLPLSATTIGLAIFTGVVMMAAKHLDFTLENIAMIIISVVLIVLEVKRNKTLKYMNPKKEHALSAYKVFGSKILIIELVLTVLIGVWMWLI